MESLFSPSGKYYPWRLFATGVVAVVLAVLLVWAEENQLWHAAQAILITMLLLSVLLGYEWWRSNHETPRLSDEAGIYNRAIHKLLWFAAMGFVALILNATSWEHFKAGNVARAVGYGTLCAGAFFVLGVLLGYLFGLRPTGPSQSSGEQSPDGRPKPTPPHTNLEEVADWFTKLILGAGLVELTRMKGPLGYFADYMARGVDPSPDPPSGYKGSPAVALAIMLFFSASGILYGYLWTRYELAVSDSSSAETSASTGGSPLEPLDHSK